MSEQPSPFWDPQPVKTDKCVGDVVAGYDDTPDGRLRSGPTAADVTGKIVGRPARYFHSPVGSKPKLPPTSGVWLSAPSGIDLRLHQTVMSAL